MTFPTNNLDILSHNDSSQTPTTPTTVSFKSIEAPSDQTAPNTIQNSYMSTLFHILAVSVGPIVFSLPCAFNMVGYVSAIIGIVIVGIFYTYNLRLFLKCCHKLATKRKVDHLTFAESVRYALEDSPYQLQKVAPIAGQFTNLLMLLTWGGELAFNVIFMCRNMRQVINYYTETSLNIRLVLACCAVPCILISSVPHLRLSVLSMVAGTIDLLFLGVVLCELYFNPSIGEVVNKRAAVETLHKLPNFLAVLFFTLNFTGIVLPLKNDMKHSRKFDSRFGTLTVAVAIVCAVNAVFGLLGYMRYGHNVQEMITFNLPRDDPFIQLMIGSYCVAIYCTYPVYFSVVFKIVWDEWISVRTRAAYGHWTFECAVRIAINAALFALMFAFPDIGMFTNIGGLICAIINSLIVPPMVQILLLDEDRKSRRLVIATRNLIFIIIGLVLLYFGLAACFHDILQVSTP